MTRVKAFILMLLVALTCHFQIGAARASEADDKAIPVEVRRDGEKVIVSASMLVPVTAQQAWTVLTDYENMPRFLPSLESSQILGRQGDRLRVSQKGKLRFGPFSLAFDYQRDVELLPFRELRSTLIGGSLKSGRVVTSLSSQGEGTRIEYHSEVFPEVWLPLGIGAATIRNHVREQMESMRAEMLRRK